MGKGPAIDDRVARASELMVSGQLDEALEVIDAVLAENPDNASALRLSALALLGRGDPAGALSQAERMVAAAPADATAHGLLSVCLRLHSRRSESRDSAERAVELDPTLPFAWDALFHIAADVNDVNTAADAAGKLVELQPGSPDGYEALGTLALGKWKLDDAERMFREALARNPHSMAALQHLSTILSNRGRNAEAVDIIRKASADLPECEAILSTLDRTAFHRVAGTVLTSVATGVAAVPLALGGHTSAALTMFVAGGLIGSICFGYLPQLWVWKLDADARRFVLDDLKNRRMQRAFQWLSTLVLAGALAGAAAVGLRVQGVGCAIVAVLVPLVLLPPASRWLDGALGRVR